MTNEIRALIEAVEPPVKLIKFEIERGGGIFSDEQLANLRAAISSAKAAEEGVETMYRVDVMDHIGWVMTTSDRFHLTEVSAYARADRAFGSAEKVKAVRVVRVESKSTVISVREKEGL